MDGLKSYFNAISVLTENTWAEIMPFFKEELLSKNEYFIRENEIAHEIAFLQSGVVRAFFVNDDGKEYNKQFFVAPSIIGAYSSLLTGQPNLIAQQALTDCVIYSCNYKTLTDRFDKHHDLERLARKIAEYYFLQKEKKEIEIILLNATQRYIIFQKEFPTLEQLIAQFHIASYLGVSATQLSRIRHQLASSKQ
jgi:CRP-like cAMP-binding protein